MKKLLFSFLLAVLPLSSFAASGTAIPGGNQSTPFVINKPGAYYLAANRVMTTLGQAAIQIDASDVTLDLNGFTLSFTNAEGPYTPGIKAKGANIEIRNGSISTVPGSAIHMDGLLENVGLRLIDLRITDSMGINTGAWTSWIERCQILDTRGNAISAGPCTTIKDCLVRNVAATTGTSTGRGIVLAHASVVTGCTVQNTSSAGVLCGASCILKNNLIAQANESRSPAEGGIVVYDRFSTITENSVISCYAAGIRVTYPARSTMLEKNIINDTQSGGPQAGFAVVSSIGSTIVRGTLGHDNAAGFSSGTFIDGGNNLVF